MKHFPYRIVIDPENRSRARKWCYNQFGKIDIKDFKGPRHCVPHQLYGGKVYDHKKSRWLNAVLSSKLNPCAFYFKNDLDAMGFKVRWS